MKNTEIKFVVAENKDGLKQALKEVDIILGAFKSILDQPLQYRTVMISPKINHETLKDALRAEYKSDIEIRDGVTGGCYGARDGSYAPGFTVWCDAGLLVDEYKDADCGHQFNPDALLKAHGSLVEDLDGDVFADQCEALGLTVKHDNTYNNENHFMFDFQFKTIENEAGGNSSNSVFMCVSYHCGGDPRGNYTSSQVWKFDSMDDVYSVLLPSMPDDESEE